jgi:hypothetical protein
MMSILPVFLIVFIAALAQRNQKIKKRQLVYTPMRTIEKMNKEV